LAYSDHLAQAHRPADGWYTRPVARLSINHLRSGFWSRRAELAPVSRTRRVGRRRRAEAAQRVGPSPKGTNVGVEDDHSRSGAFQPDRVGRSHLRSHRGEQQTGCGIQARTYGDGDASEDRSVQQLEAILPEPEDGSHGLGSRGLPGCAQGEAARQIDVRQLHAGHGWAKS